jgi:LuxR family transcriptional regulator, transcriptional regulator of spore coat protein
LGDNMPHYNTSSAVELTNRETEVLQLVAYGLSAKKVARELAIAACTVERHIENVRLKTRTRNRAHMIAYVIRTGMLPMHQETS